MAVSRVHCGSEAAHRFLNTIPWIIYTSPEVAWVSKTEQQCKSRWHRCENRAVSIHGQWPALGQGESSGFVKIIADAKTDRVLGGHVIHAHASELIQEIVTVMEFKGASEDIRASCTAIPLSEAVRGGAGGGEAR